MNTVTSISELKQNFPFWNKFTDDQIRASYVRSREGIEIMRDRAIRTGKKQGGFSVDQLNEIIDNYTKILNA